METFDCAELLLLRTPSGERGRTKDSGEESSILSIPSLGSPDESEHKMPHGRLPHLDVSLPTMPQRSGLGGVGHCEIKLVIGYAPSNQCPTPQSAKAIKFPPPESPSSASASATFFRAAQARRRALKAAPGDATQGQRVRSLSNSRTQNRKGNDSAMATRSRSSTPSKYKSIAYEYLPTKKTYWSYDPRKLEKVPVLQRWARQQLQHRRRRHALIGIQCAWRTYRAQFHLISSCLLKEW
jgi:hypothetical protein